MELPLVSICVPTYNGEEFIEEAMVSAMNQTYSNLEIIVSDDDSKDNTIKIIRKFDNPKNIPVKIYKHEPDGIGANWNNCVARSNGKFIKFLFQDDVLEANCIEELIKPFFENKNVGLSFCRRKFIYDSPNDGTIRWVKDYGAVHESWKYLDSVQKGTDLLKAENFFETPLNKVGEPTAVLLRKDVFSRVGHFNTSLKQALDYEFWYRVFTKFHVAFVDKELISFRLHDNQTTRKNSKVKIIDYNIYPYLIYRNCLWHLNSALRLKLLKKYHPAFIFYYKVKRKCKALLQSSKLLKFFKNLFRSL